MTDAGWETLSNQAIAVAGGVYFLALLAHLVEWSALRKVPVARAERRSQNRVAAAAAGAVSTDRSLRSLLDHPESPVDTTRRRTTRRLGAGSRCSAGWGCC